MTDQICPFCATNVPAGFTVCSGCGANYRSNVGAGVKGMICCAIMVLIFLGLGSSWSGFYLLALIFAVAGVGNYMSMQPRWYRRNA
jgi:O-antigen ligase